MISDDCVLLQILLFIPSWPLNASELLWVMIEESWLTKLRIQVSYCHLLADRLLRDGQPVGMHFSEFLVIKNTHIFSFLKSFI